MTTEIIPVRANGLEHTRDEIFSAYTHPRLEDFIQKVIDASRDSLPTEASQKLVREFFLYGFLRVSGQEFLWWGDEKEIVQSSDESGRFGTNNGILAVADFDKEIYIRGGDSYHGYFPWEGEEPQGVEGTLLNSGYKSLGVYVPHSNGDVFVDEKMRGKGIGNEMLSFLARLAIERGCGRMEWWVLDWNEPAIRFYRKLGAQAMDGWTVYRLNADQMHILADY